MRRNVLARRGFKWNVERSNSSRRNENIFVNQQSKTMKAVAIDEFGGIEKMKVRDLPIPQVAPDEILVHVETAGVGAWDPFEREGGFAREFGVKPQFPYVLGSDGAGTVESVGKEVHGLKKGDRVYGINLMNPKGGFYAQFATLKAEHAAAVPKKLSIQQAGVMAVDAVTALQGLVPFAACDSACRCSIVRRWIAFAWPFSFSPAIRRIRPGARLDPRSLHKLSSGIEPACSRSTARHQTMDRRNRSQAVRRAQGRHDKGDYSLPRPVSS
jgi:hypothetical protein